MAGTAEAVADKEAATKQREKPTTKSHKGNVTILRAMQETM